ncbi:unnamed protein product [Trichobilharzia szidati]|nr:unnamed protein product [Trichobilharzia szidati]
MSTEEKEMCPLCMEPMEADDLAFYPCDCRYQVCRFCWAKIINEENGLCPACRKEYNSEKPASYKPISESEESRCRSSRRRKEYMKKTKLNPEMLKILPELRVVQPNLIFVVGLPTWISKDKDILKGQDYFGRYGKIFKVEVNQNQTFGGPQGQPSFSAYITYYRAEDAMRSIRDLNQSTLHGRPIRVSLGTTKYCSQFLRGTKCTKHECMYLHELGDSAASFTKEEMQAGKHTEYMNKLLQEFCQSKSSCTLDSQKEETTILGPVDSSGSNTNDATISHPVESSSHSNGRSRVRYDGTSSMSSENSNFQMLDRSTSQSEQTSDSGRNVSTRDTRKLRHTDKDHMSGNSVSDASVNDKSKLSYGNSNKSSNWNHSSSSSDYSYRKPAKNSFGTFHFKNTPETTDAEKSYGVGGKSVNVRHNHSVQNRIPVTQSAPSNQVSTAAEPVCTNSNSCHRTWCRPTSVNSSNMQPLLGDEPADIDFDPFRESQQGLAELLAAEVARLEVSDSLSNHRVCYANGSSVNKTPYCSTGGGGDPVKSQSSHIDTRVPQTTVGCDPSQPTGIHPWYPNLMSYNRSNNDADKVSNVSYNNFTSHYPPPGFEEAVKAYDQASSNNQFLSSSAPDPLSPAYPEPNYSCPENFGCNNNNIHNTTGSLLQSTAFSRNLPSTDSSSGKYTANSMSLENWLEAKRISDHISAMYPDTFYSPIPPPLPNVNNNQVKGESIPQNSSQFMNNVFTAVFNAPGVTSNGATSMYDKSAAKSSASMFDLSQLINQLYCQSSSYSETNTHPPNDWSARVSMPLGCTQNEVVDSSMCSSSAAPNPNIFIPGKYVSRTGSFPSNNEYQQHQKMLFGINNGFPGCSNTGMVDVDPHHSTSSDHPASSVVTWQLDDPAIVSSRLSSTSLSNCIVKNNQVPSTWKPPCNLSSPPNLLEQIWRTTPNFQSFFDPSLASSYMSQSGYKNQNQSQQSRDTVIHHSSSHAKLTE